MCLIEIEHDCDCMKNICCSILITNFLCFFSFNFRMVVIRSNEKVLLMLQDVFKVHQACLSTVDEVFSKYSINKKFFSFSAVRFPVINVYFLTFGFYEPHHKKH